MQKRCCLATRAAFIGRVGSQCFGRAAATGRHTGRLSVGVVVLMPHRPDDAGEHPAEGGQQHEARRGGAQRWGQAAGNSGGLNQLRHITGANQRGRPGREPLGDGVALIHDASHGGQQLRQIAALGGHRIHELRQQEEGWQRRGATPGVAFCVV